MTGAISHGDQLETQALIEAVTHNCACPQKGVTKYDNNGRAIYEPPVCGAHLALAGDQKFLDALLFERRDRQRLTSEEFKTEDWENN